MKPRAIAVTAEQHRKAVKQAFWQAYGNFLLGTNTKTQRFLGLTILALALGKVLTSQAHACPV